MIMRKISIIAAACATLSLGILSTAAMAAELVPVKVAALRSIAASPIVIAKAKGYFEEAGLDVEIVNFKNTATMVAPLSAGQIDAAAGAPTLGFYNAKLNGLKMKLVADLGRNSPGHGFNAVVVRKDLYDEGKVTSLADFKGLTVGSVSPNSPLDIQLDIGLKKEGMGLSDVELQVLSFPNMMAALATKNLDAAVLVEPFVARAGQNDLGVRIIGADEISPDFNISGVIYGEAFMNDKPEEAAKYLEAYVRGVRFYLDAIKTEEGKDELFAIISEYARLKERSILDEIAFPGFNEDGYFNTDTINLTMDWYTEKGLLKEKPKMADMVDFSYLNKALDKIGRKGPRMDVQ